MTDRFAGMRGKWDKSGVWWCDCPAKNPDTRRHCSRCDIRRPLKGSLIYELRDPNQGAGFMRDARLREAEP